MVIFTKFKLSGEVGGQMVGWVRGWISPPIIEPLCGPTLKLKTSKLGLSVAIDSRIRSLITPGLYIKSYKLK